MKKVSKKAKRRVFLIFTCMAIAFTFLVKTVFNDWKQILINNRETKILSAKYESLLEEEISLEAEVIKFQDPEYVARYAREKYLYSLPGELIIRIPKK